MDMDFAKKLVVQTVTDKGGCRYTTLNRCAAMDSFKLRLPEVVDALVQEKRLIRVCFDVPMYGRAEFLFPVGTLISPNSQDALSRIWSCGGKR